MIDTGFSDVDYFGVADAIVQLLYVNDPACAVIIPLLVERGYITVKDSQQPTYEIPEKFDSVRQNVDNNPVIKSAVVRIYRELIWEIVGF